MMDEDQDDQGNKRLVGANFQSSSDQNNENGDFELRTISSTNDDYIVPPRETRLTFGSIRDSMLKLNDGGYGWAVVFAVFFVHVVIIGNLFSFGVFFATYNDTFSASQGSIAWIGSIGAFLMSALAHFSGALGDYWGNDKVVCLGGILVGIGYFLASYSTELWHLYFTQGLIAGAGYGIAFVAGVGVVGQWFDKQTGLAVGIAVAGSGFGQFVMTLLTGGLLNKYGWQETLVILAFINMTLLVSSSLLIQRAFPLASKLNLQRSFAIFNNREFQLLFACSVLNSLGNMMPYTYIVLYAEYQGISRNAAILISSIVGLASLAGRIICGFFADQYGKLFIFQICVVISSISTLCWMACTTFPTILL